MPCISIADENMLTSKQSDDTVHRQVTSSSSLSSVHLQKAADYKNVRDFSVAAIMGGPVGNVSQSASTGTLCLSTSDLSNSINFFVPSDATYCHSASEINFSRAEWPVSCESQFRVADKRMSADGATAVDRATTRSPLLDINHSLTQGNRRHTLPKAGRVLPRSVDDKLTTRKRRASSTKSEFVVKPVSCYFMIHLQRQP